MATYYGYTGPESPSEYLEEHIFPILLPGMEEMLRTAMATERRKRFNSLDFLTAYLYRNNCKHTGRDDVTLDEIPFVKEEWSKNPRPPLPISATLTEEEACIIIQSFFRGYLARCTTEAQLFREWQRGLREERRAVRTIENFWNAKLAEKKRLSHAAKREKQISAADSTPDNQ